jgi:hypothetical protein
MAPGAACIAGSGPLPARRGRSIPVSLAFGDRLECSTQPGPHPGRADVAQLVEHHLAKVRVAGSNPVVRSEAPDGVNRA